MTQKLTLIACGILQKEINVLISKNSWPVSPVYLPSGLHVDFGKLQYYLQKCLKHYGDQPRVVFYGACHPLMDQILGAANTIRTPGQNCVDIYLGSALFNHELAEGAFFLFEDWALHWDGIIGGKRGLTPAVMRDIFHSAHTRLLAIRTPCSGDFSAQAEEISRRIALELHWIDVGLEHLEQALGTVISDALKGLT